MSRAARRVLLLLGVSLTAAACRGHAHLPDPPSLPEPVAQAHGGPPPKALQHYALGVIAWQRGKLTKASEHLGIALAFDPHSSWLHHTRGRIAIARGDHEDAQAALARAVALDPANPDPRLLLARVLTLQGDHAAAEAQLEGLLARQRHDQAFVDLAHLRLLRGDRAGAALALEAWAEQPPARLSLLRQRVKLRLELDQAWEAWDDLALLIESGEAESRDVDQFIDVAHTTRRYRSTLELLERLVAWQPGDQESVARLGGLSDAVNDSCRAARAWAKLDLLEGGGGSSTRLILGQAQLACGDAQGALTTIATVQPDDVLGPFITLMRARVLHATGSHDEALAEIGAEQDRFFTFEGLDLQLEILEAKGYPTRALETARQAWQTRQTNARATKTLARQEAQNGNLDRAIELMTQGERAVAVGADLAVGIARLQGLAGEDEAALATLARAELDWPEDPGPPQLHVTWLANADRLEEAHAVASAASQRLPQELACTRQLAWLEDRMGMATQAVSRLEEALVHHPDDAWLLNDLAYLLVERGDHSDRVLAMARRSVDQRPARASFLDTLGWILLARAEVEAALHELEHASRLAPADTVLAEHLAAARSRAASADETK